MPHMEGLWSGSLISVLEQGSSSMSEVQEQGLCILTWALTLSHMSWAVCAPFYLSYHPYFSDKSVRNMCGSDIVVLQYVLIATNHNFFHCMQLQVLARDSWIFLLVVQCSYFHVYLISTCYISLQWDQIKYSLVLVLQIHKEMLSSGISIFLQTSLKNKAKGILCLLPM